MSTHAFHPDSIVTQIKAFFSDVHDLTGFYYKLYLLNGLCGHCDGRGYLHDAAQPCSDCQGSGSRDVWRRPAVRAEQQ